MSHRRRLANIAAQCAATPSPAASAAQLDDEREHVSAWRPRVAAICTTFFPRSHGDVICTKLIKGMSLDEGFAAPRIDIVSLYIDCIAANVRIFHPLPPLPSACALTAATAQGVDVGVSLAAQHGVPMYPSIHRALLADSPDGTLGVDAVLLIGEVSLLRCCCS